MCPYEPGLTRLTVTGDYVHIINPEDPSRPIPAQVYRSFIPTG